MPGQPAEAGRPRQAAGPSGPITGSQIDERSLGQVPSAAYADVAGTAQTAIDAQTALNAVNAVDATTVNGHGAGCRPATTPFAGACWQTSANATAVTAPVAAAACAAQGGTLPEALELAAFAQQPDIESAAAKSGRGTSQSSPGPMSMRVVTVTPDWRSRTSPLRPTPSTYRCVIPIVV